MKLKTYITFLFTLFTCAFFAQEAAFTATVSKNKLGVNQRLRVEFSINKQGGDNFTPPNFKNFKVVGGPSQSVSQSWINGKASFNQSYTYIIEPRNTGEFNLPPASIEIDGKTLQTEPIKIIVTEAVEIPKDPNDPNYIAEQNIHLVTEVSKANPYLGEAVYVEYRLYFNNNIQISDYGITETPKYNGFWNQEIKLNGLPVKTTTYNGEPYKYAVLHKAVLIPTKAGKLSIEPMKMDIVVGVPTGMGDFFGNAIVRHVKKEFSSSKRTVQAKSLPTEGKPESFTGAVGEYAYEVISSKNSLKANESSNITVKVSGEGNLKLFELPKIETPKELEVYQPERKENVTTSAAGMKGSVSNSYTVVPEYKGKYKIPSTEFSYFNPKDEKYHTITSEDLYVEVLEGKELVTNTNSTTISKQTVAGSDTNFRYIQTDTSLQPKKNSDFFNGTLFYTLLILPLLAIPLAIFIGKKKEAIDSDIIGNKQRKADKLAKKYLSEAQKQLGNKEPFYEALERALHNFLKAKLRVETSDISREKISQLLQNKGVDTATITNFISVFNDCDFARYTPITNVQMNEEYEKVKRIITELDKQL